MSEPHPTDFLDCEIHVTKQAHDKALALTAARRAVAAAPIREPGLRAYLRPDRVALALSSAGFTPGRFTVSRYGEHQEPLHSRSFTDAATDLLAALGPLADSTPSPEIDATILAEAMRSEEPSGMFSILAGHPGTTNRLAPGFALDLARMVAAEYARLAKSPDIDLIEVSGGEPERYLAMAREMELGALADALAEAGAFMLELVDQYYGTDHEFDIPEEAEFRRHRAVIEAAAATRVAP